MKQLRHDPQPLTNTEWSTVAHALATIEEDGAELVSRILRRVRVALTGTAPAVTPVDPRTAAIRAFVSDARRFGRPADAAGSALLGHGFNARQIAALAALSIH